MQIFKGLVIPIMWMAPLGVFSQVKYYPSIHHLIGKHCVSCHTSGENTPFVFRDYDDVAKRIQTILKVTDNNIMPPWPADTTYVRYHDQNVLTASEKKMLHQWVKDGMLKGKEEAVKKSRKTLVSPSNMRLSVATQDTIGPVRQDIYTYGILNWYFEKPVYVKGYTFNIKTPFLHHSEILSVKLDSVITPAYNKYVQTNSYEFRQVNIDKYLLGWFPGSSCGVFPKGTHMTLQPGEKFMVILHYVPTTRKFTDSSLLLINSTDEASGREIDEFAVHGTRQYVPSLTNAVFIKANTTATFHASEIVPYDMSAFAVYGHAHHLCRNMIAYAITPSGDTIRLMKINDWKFNWQLTYRFDNYVKIPKNSIVHFYASYDNTIANADNQHNPPKDVYASFMADDEMMEFFILHLKYKQGDEKVRISYEK